MHRLSVRIRPLPRRKQRSPGWTTPEWRRGRMLASVSRPTSRSDGYSLDSVMVGSKKRLIPFRDQTSDGRSRDGSHDNAGKCSRRKRRLYVLKTSCCFNGFMKDEVKFQELPIRRCLGFEAFQNRVRHSKQRNGCSQKTLTIFSRGLRWDGRTLLLKQYGHMTLFNSFNVLSADLTMARF